jgi:hypothetical protein
VKAIKHSHHGTVLRLDNESAHLLVGSGKWVYISKFEARDAALSPRRSWLARIGMFVAAALAVMALLMLTTSAQAAKLDCLTTQAQARKVYPAQALKYRRIDDTRCWYAGRTRAKSEFSLPATASFRGGVESRHALHPSERPPSVDGQSRKAGSLGKPDVAPGPREINHAGETSSRSTERVRPQPGEVSASRRGEPAPNDPHRTAYSVTFEHDAILAACGMPCPHLMAFEDRWQIATGKRR